MVQHSPCTKLLGANQRDACETILELLDGSSRFALTEAKALRTDVARYEHVYHTVTFSSHRHGRAPDESGEKESTDYVRKLGFANCFALSSGALRFDSCCENLRELCCENGIVGTPALLCILCQRPVNKLGCSLCEDHRYEPLLAKEVFVHISRNYQLLTQKLEFTYTEVVGTPLTAEFLDCILNPPIDLEPVHVHTICRATGGLPVGDACMTRNTHRNGLRIFRYSGEQVPPTTGRLCRDVSCTYVRLENLLEQRVLLKCVRHAAVAFEAYPEAVCRFLGSTTHEECRYDVRSSSHVLLPSPQCISFQRPSCMAGDCLKLKHKLLLMCLANISEPSLTTSHFSFGGDFCFALGEGLSELSLLKLRRCATVIWEGLLLWLARGYRFLDELGVGNRDVVPCAACKFPPMFTERDFEQLLLQTKLWRLGIGESAKIMTVTFPLGRLVTDPRFNLDGLASDATSVSCRGFCQRLCANPGLFVSIIESLRFYFGRESDKGFRVAHFSALRRSSRPIHVLRIRKKNVRTFLRCLPANWK
ncbi:uncharacterized protein [Dermacentor albipictus]|uniref:uncharacterized protein isoform X1 n=1 Tax=Dermacentor albipictus TaxID=60249 RepID=UPI0031FE3FD1